MSRIGILLLLLAVSALIAPAAAAGITAAATTIPLSEADTPGTATPGPVERVMVTALPMNITVPGTYTLDRDYLNVAAPLAIDVRCSDVVIDGAGHLVDGVDSAGTVGIRIHGSAALSGVTVKNLRVTDWAQGVYFYNARGRIEGVTSSSNTGAGLLLYMADTTVITGCTAESNGVGGISVSYAPGVEIASCTVRSNADDGIYLYGSSNARVTGTTTSGNTLSGIALLGTGSGRITGAVVSGCRATGNGKAGIYMSRAQGNTVVNNRFENSRNAFLEGTEIGPNTWNTPKTAGTNIADGAWLGGNWWSGFSETAVDADRDGLADQAYTIDAANSDALPLAAPGSTPTPTTVSTTMPITTPTTVPSSTAISPGMKITTPGTYTLAADIRDGVDPAVVEIACSNVVIEGNGHTIQGGGQTNFCGVYVRNPAGSAGGIVIRNLTVANFYLGIYMLDADGARIERCRILDTPTDGKGLILAQGSDGATVTGTAILSSPSAAPGTTGIFLASSAGSVITDNEFCSPVNVLFGGTVGAGSWNGVKTAGANIVGGPYLGGNYWAEPDGTGWSQTVADADHDGIGDSPCVLGTGNVDALPLVRDRPAASFAASTVNGTAPLAVMFTDTSTSSPTSWSWSFGDGGTSTLRNPVHTYAGAGTFTVSLSVRNAAGYADTETRPGLVTVAPPLALTSVAPGTGLQGSVVVAVLAGTGFQPGMTVRLTRAGCSAVEAGRVDVVSPTRISCQFRLPFTAETSGAWDVVVTDPGNRSVTLPNAVTCTRSSAAIVIAQPGSYLLANDIVNCNRVNGIEIRCSDVVLDGGGHQVDGIDTRSSAGVLVEGPTVPVSNVTVRNIRLQDWWYGASLHRAGASRVEGATLSSNGYAGAVIYQSAVGDAVADCTVTGNDNGVAFVDGAADGTVSGCRIENNVRGLYVYLSDGLTLAHTRIANSSESGIQYHLSAGGTIYDNRLENGLNVLFTGEPYKANDWSVTPRAGPNIVGGPAIGGNYWAAPDGTGFSRENPDSDGDGFVDIPLQIAEQNFDLHPLAPPGTPAPGVTAIPGGAGTPSDTNGDGLCDDVNGNSRSDFADIVLYFNQMSWVAANEPVAAFDFNGNGRIDFADVAWLFGHL